MSKLACITVNLQGLAWLCRKCGVDERSLLPAGAAAVSRRAPERFAELLDRKAVPATFFVAGDDLEDGPSAMAIGELFRLGHELGTFGKSGDPGLALRPEKEIEEELGAGIRALEELTGRRPVGFRCAGQNLTPPLLKALEEEDFHYDASVFPSAPAWAARLFARTAFGAPAIQRPDSPALLVAPRVPYRPSYRDPYKRGSARLIELPVATVPVSRLPFTGTFLLSLPKAGAAALFRAVRYRRFLSVEVQGWDLLDESDAAIPELARRRPDLRQPWSAKWQRLSELIEWLRNDFEIVTAEEAAHRLAPRLP